ncbi:MAG: hypothetical protein ABL876_08095 [Chitinophagaceae bacterium]
MKKIYLSFSLIVPLFLAAQKNVDLDRFHFTAQYRSLPSLRLDTTYRTYNVEVGGSQLMESALSKISPEKSVLLEGWRKLESTGHITVRVTIEDILPVSVSVKERVENKKNANGQVIGTRTLYHEEVVYTFAARAGIADYKGAHIMDIELDDRSYKKVHSGPEFALKGMAEGYFLLNAVTITSDLYRSCVNSSMHYLSEQLNDNFGFSEVSVKDMMWIIGNRKHPEYAAHRQAFQQFNEAIFSMTASSPLDDTREKMKPVIAYFESIKKNYPSTSKHDRKIRYASYYNLAVIYYYLDDPQRMMAEAKGLELNDFDAKDAKGFEQSAIRLKNLFQQTNIYTRHFEIDPSAFKGPYEEGTVLATQRE